MVLGGILVVMVPNERRLPPPTTPGPKGETYDALASVLKDQAEKARARREAPVPREGKNGPLLLAVVVILAALSGYLWISPPAWITPSAPPAPAPQLAEAGAKMEVYLQALNVQGFLEREGRLPHSLEEAGDPDSSVVFELLGSNRYRLSLDGPGGVVLYQSTEPLDRFLGNAMQIIREGG